MLNKLYNKTLAARLVNSVHDSVLFEILDDNLEEEIPIIEKELSEVPKVLLETFGVTSPIPFPVDFETGKTLAKVKNKA